MNLHKVVEEIYRQDCASDFVDALGFAAVPKELWEQVLCFMTNQVSRSEAQIRFLGERGHGSAQLERAQERRDNIAKLLKAIKERKPLVLKRCTCWYAANPNVKHPDEFNCYECQNTGNVQPR